MTPEFRIIDEDYISKSNVKSENSQLPDWFNLYNNS